MKLNQSNSKPIESPRTLSCVATLSDFFFGGGVVSTPLTGLGHYEGMMKEEGKIRGKEGRKRIIILSCQTLQYLEYC